MSRVVGSALVGLALLACGSGAPRTQQTPTATTEPTAQASAAFNFDDIATVASGLEVPWALAFLDDETILVTERAGTVRVVERGTLRDEPVATIDVRAEGEGGLMGIAVHPDFPAERSVYVCYTASDGNRISRFPLGDDLTFGDEEVVLEGIPAARFHDGGRIAFSPDGLLYVTTGDAGDPDSAASRSSLAGKILRLTPDGSPAPDNPFDDAVFSYGHRNPQGIAWDDEGHLYASEHGPTSEPDLCCQDEINLIEAGAFYGWPVRAGDAEAFGGDPPEEPVAPIRASGSDTWAPAGLAVASSDGGTSLFVATLRGERLMRFDIAGDDPRRVTDVSTALDGYGRLRAAVIGPDGCLYLTTSNRDGRGDPADEDDRLLRACPGTG